ncbi:hypothetical protein ISCGN_014143 [Ixodes scapularis]
MTTYAVCSQLAHSRRAFLERNIPKQADLNAKPWHSQARVELAQPPKITLNLPLRRNRDFPDLLRAPKAAPERTGQWIAGTYQRRCRLLKSPYASQPRGTRSLHARQENSRHPKTLQQNRSQAKEGNSLPLKINPRNERRPFLQIESSQFKGLHI